MKRFFNVCAILLAICLAASFVSCKNNDDDDDDSSVVTSDSSVVTSDSSVVAGDSSDSSVVAGDSSDSSVVAVYKYSDSDGTDTFTFYYDNTLTYVFVNASGQTDSKTGRWTGSLSGAGTIIMYGETLEFSVSGNIMTINNSLELIKQ